VTVLTISPGRPVGTVPVDAASGGRGLLSLLFVIGVLLLLVLPMPAFIGQRARHQRRWVRQHLRAEPHPSPAHATVDQDPHGPPTLSVRLQPHDDAGTQILKEGD
jgi:hypothetical protein